ncbi:MAG: nuclear transport factor 2 family protein [Waterburya sp.]
MKKEILVILTVLAALQLPSAANILNGFEKIEAISEVKTQSSADTLSEFRNIELQWLTAVKNSPKAALKAMMQEMLSEDFVYQHGSGQNFTKAKYIRLLSKGEITVEKLGKLDLSIRDYGETVISYGSSPMTGKLFGNPYSGRLRFINVWHKDKNGSWHLTHRNSELLSE